MTCPECGGVGSVRVIVGDEEFADRCRSCGGTCVVADLVDENDMMGDETIPPEYIEQQEKAA